MKLSTIAIVIIILLGGMELSAETKTLQDYIDSIQPLSGYSFQVRAQELEDGLVFRGAADPAFTYSGRIDFTDRDAPVIIWQGSQIRFGFTGQRLVLRFDKATDRNFFNVIIDGKITLLRLENDREYDYLLSETLDAGPHAAVLFKRSEAMFGNVRFKGVMLEAGAALTAPVPAPVVKIEFYGDSITAGACDENPAEDNYDDLSSHNNYTSYGAVAARTLGAEYSNISYSGIGICASWHPLLMPRVWDRLYPTADSPVYAFADRPPDIVVMNLGQNDYGFTDNQKQPFPANFQTEYVGLVSAIRARYANAWIVCAMGGMSAIKSSRELNKAWSAAMKQLSADPKIVSFTFRAFTYNHPRVDTHIKLADELVKFIRKAIPSEEMEY